MTHRSDEAVSAGGGCTRVPRYEFSERARLELMPTLCSKSDVAESILNAVAIDKTIRSTSRWHRKRPEHLHIIHSTNLDGISVYTKGKLVDQGGLETSFFLVSAKRCE